MPKYFVKGQMTIRGKLVEGTAAKPTPIELPSDRFWISKGRYLSGEYVHATPEDPAEIRLPEGAVIDRSLRPGEPPAPPKPHYVPSAKAKNSAAEHFSKPKDGERGNEKGADDKRPADGDLL